MATSSSSSSSYGSSSLGRPPRHGQTLYPSPYDSSWTPNSSGASGVSALTSQGSTPSDPQSSLRPLDLGPPGYEATITLYENTSRERTIYLGPWEVVGSHNRRVLWSCTYQNELLEHFLPADDVYPHTLHARHRPYTEAADMERFVTFCEPHRIRYTTEDGTVAHDEVITARYEFTTVESSVRFQGQVRAKTLQDYYDVDVVWSDVHGRTDRFGSVRGMACVQRLKMWTDNYSNLHSITVYANRTSRQYLDYEVHWFDAELRSRDDRAKQIRFNVRGRRGSAPDTGRRFSFNRIRPRVRSIGHGSQGESSDYGLSQNPRLDIRYLCIQFSSRDDYRRFLDDWASAHISDSQFHGVPFPRERIELESPHIPPNPVELDAGLDTVPEPGPEEEDTP